MSQNGPKTTLLMMSLTKNQQPQPKKFFLSADKMAGRSVSPLEQLSSANDRGAMVLVRQLTTVGFRPISKYEYIVSKLSKC